MDGWMEKKKKEKMVGKYGVVGMFYFLF